MAAACSGAALYRAVIGRRRRLLDQARAALIRAQAAHTELLRSSGEWIWSLDPAGRIQCSSQAIEELLGYDADALVGRPLLDLVDPTERDAIGTALARAVNDGAGWSNRRIRLRHRDGTPRWVDLSTVVVHDEHGRVDFLHGAARDVSQRVDDGASRSREGSRRSTYDAVRAAIDGDGLSIVYQPIVSLRTGRIAGVEALARFDRPFGDGPADWFAEAASLGLGVELELAALRCAVLGWPTDLGGFISINASPATVLSPGLLQDLHRLEAPLDRVVIELTEHVQVVDYESLGESLAGIRELGVRIAVDDAGAGYATLRHILRLAPDLIKLDRALVAGIEHDPARRALVTALGDFGRQIGASVIGEGVESADELRTLQVCGVPLAQGYFLARPSSPPITLAPGAIDLGSVRVLVADDDPAARALFTQLLERAGHDVVQAADGLEAVDMVAEHCPDVIILDYDMPHLGAVGALPILRELAPRTPIVVVSSSAPDAAVTALEPDARLTKQDALAALPALISRLATEPA